MKSSMNLWTLVLAGSFVTGCVSKSPQREVASTGVCRPETLANVKSMILPIYRNLEQGTKIADHDPKKLINMFNDPAGYKRQQTVAMVMQNPEDNYFSSASEKDRPAWKAKHRQVSALTQEALSGRNVEQNVQQIIGYLTLKEQITEPESAMNSIATTSLGLIGHPMAARPLMEGIQASIRGQRTVPFERVRAGQFFAPIALRYLNYGQDESLRSEVEDFLIDLSKQYIAYHYKGGAKSYGYPNYNGFDALGARAFNTPKTRVFLTDLLGTMGDGSVDTWISRILLEWGDPSVAPIMLNAIANPQFLRSSLSFDPFINRFVQYKSAFAEAGLDTQDVFNRVFKTAVNVRQNIGEPNVFLRLQNLIPEECLSRPALAAMNMPAQTGVRE